MIIPTKESEAKIIEKKSSFTAYVFPLENENDVNSIIEKVKKKNKSANHLPYAYRILKYINGKKSCGQGIAAG